MARAALARRRSSAPAPDGDARGRRVDWTPLAVETIRPRRLYAQIAEQIEALLRQHNLNPGDRLPPEKVLARALGISRLSLREAMIALESAGLIEVRVGSGTYVRTIMPAGYRFPWSRHDDPGPGVREQFVARKLVEPEVAALAAEHATAEEIAALAEATNRAERLFKAGSAADDDDYAFHVGLAEASRNSVLAAFVRQLWDMRRNQMWGTLRGRVVKPEHRLEVIEDRRAVVAALRKREPAAARAAIKRFLARAERRYFD